MQEPPSDFGSQKWFLLLVLVVGLAECSLANPNGSPAGISQSPHEKNLSRPSEGPDSSVNTVANHSSALVNHSTAVNTRSGVLVNNSVAVSDVKSTDGKNESTKKEKRAENDNHKTKDATSPAKLSASQLHAAEVKLVADGDLAVAEIVSQNSRHLRGAEDDDIISDSHVRVMDQGGIKSDHHKDNKADSNKNKIDSRRTVSSPNGGQTELKLVDQPLLFEHSESDVEHKKHSDLHENEEREPINREDGEVPRSQSDLIETLVEHISSNCTTTGADNVHVITDFSSSVLENGKLVGDIAYCSQNICAGFKSQLLIT